MHIDPVISEVSKWILVLQRVTNWFNNKLGFATCDVFYIFKGEKFWTDLMQRRDDSSHNQDTVNTNIELKHKECGRLSCKYLNGLYACLVIFHHWNFTLSFRFADIKVDRQPRQNCQLLVDSRSKCSRTIHYLFGNHHPKSIRNSEQLALESLSKVLFYHWQITTLWYYMSPC